MFNLFKIDGALVGPFLGPALFRNALVVEIKLIYYLRQASGANNIVAINFSAAFSTFGMHDCYSSGPPCLSPIFTYIPFLHKGCGRGMTKGVESVTDMGLKLDPPPVKI
jgi:hypothetical protein